MIINDSEWSKSSSSNGLFKLFKQVPWSSRFSYEIEQFASKWMKTNVGHSSPQKSVFLSWLIRLRTLLLSLLGFHPSPRYMTQWNSEIEALRLGFPIAMPIVKEVSLTHAQPSLAHSFTEVQAPQTPLTHSLERKLMSPGQVSCQPYLAYQPTEFQTLRGLLSTTYNKSPC